MLKPLTYSALSTFRNCQKRYDYRYNREIQPNEVAEPLWFGGIWHKIMAAHYQGISPEKILGDTDSLKQDSTRKEREISYFNLAIAMYRAYSQIYARENFTVENVESGFHYEITHTETGADSRTFYMAGKVDALVSMPNGDLFIIEHKTASAITGDYIDRLPLDFQIHLYSLYLAKTIKRPITGVIYNIAVKSQIRQGKGETEEEYQTRYQELCAKNKSGKSNAVRQMPETNEEFQARLAEKYKDPGMFHRETLYLSQDDLDATENEVWQLTQRILETRRNGFWLRNTDACFVPGRTCPYFELCRSHDNPNILENFYHLEPPNIELSETEQTEKTLF